MKILVVENDDTTAVAIAKVVAASHYLVDTAQDGWTALELVKTYDYDLLVLDVVIPGLDGISLCRQLRKEERQLPIMMLTARGNISDRVLGLEAGADDYVVKPCDWAELTARIFALLRRRQATLAQLLTWENLRVDPNTKKVIYNEQPIHLTRKEYGLLELFLRHPQRIFSRSAILDYLWSPTDSPGEWTVTTHIKGLRQKLQIVGMKTEPIETIYGLGYRLRAAPKTDLPHQVEQQSKSQQKTIVKVATCSNSFSKTQVLQDIAEIWETFQETLQVLFELFEKAIEPTTGNLNIELQHQSLSKAHQLIAALRTLKVPKGTETAQQIEQLLENLETHEVKRLSELVDTLKQAVVARKLLKGQAHECPEALKTTPHPRHLLTIDDRKERTKQLKNLAIDYDLQIDVVADLKLASAQILAHPPDAILLNLAIAATERTGREFLEQLALKHAQIPVVVLEAHPESSDDVESRWRARLEVARLVKYRILSPLNSPDFILRAVAQTLDPQKETHSQ